jgi:hypothetical protein
MSGFQGLKGMRSGVDDDGQFVIQVVRGSGGNGTGSVGMRQSFHNSTLAGERKDFRTSTGELPLESAENKKMFA